MDTFKKQHDLPSGHKFLYSSHMKNTLTFPPYLPQISVLLALGLSLSPRSYHLNQVQQG